MDSLPIGSVAYLDFRGFKIVVKKREGYYEAWASTPPTPEYHHYKGRGETPESAIGDFVVQASHDLEWSERG